MACKLHHRCSRRQPEKRDSAGGEPCGVSLGRGRFHGERHLRDRSIITTELNKVALTAEPQLQRPPRIVCWIAVIHGEGVGCRLWPEVEHPFP